MDPAFQVGLTPGEASVASSDIELLIQATLNEKNAPEILEFQTGPTSRLQDALEAQASCEQEDCTALKLALVHALATDTQKFCPPACFVKEKLVEDLEQDMAQELRRMMLSLENKRVRYLLKLYHRTRLKKIEKFAASIVADPEYYKRLSECVALHFASCAPLVHAVSACCNLKRVLPLNRAELSYCQEYFKLVGRHLKTVVLDQLPSDFKPLVGP